MNIKGLLALAGIGLALSFGAARVEAQGGGGGGFGGGGGGGGRNFDPAQFRQMILDGMRDQLEVTNDAEWKVIGDQVQKVFDAQREQGFGGGLNMMRMLRRNNNNGQGGGGNTQGGARRAGMATALGADIPDPEGEALQSAIDRNAAPAELKAAIAKVAAVRKQKQAKLDQARSDLRELLTPRQEAIAVSLGLL
jgi:hypothetical protein